LNAIDEFKRLSSVSETIAKVLAENYCSLSILAMSSPSEVHEKCQISIRTAQRVVADARTELGIAPITASEMFEELDEHPKITTLSQNLDEILGGGFQTGAITELSGAYSTGKTQIAFQICLTVQLSQDEGGLGGTAYFIDTEGTFSPRRVAEMSNFIQDMLPKKPLENVLISRAFNTDHQIRLVRDADKIISKRNVRVLVVDSVATHFRSEYSTKVALPQRQQALMRHAEDLQRYADSYELVVITTNQVLANPDAFVTGSAIEPALGYAWGHRPKHRMFLRKSRGSARIAQVFDSPELPQRECVFYVTPAGIRDIDQI
jgi:DNA repair protein RadA